MPYKKTDTGIVHFISNHAGLWTDIVSEETSIDVTQLLSWAEFGSVYLNDSRVFESSLIQDQDYLRIHTAPRRYPRISLLDRIVVETDEFIIVNKPSGLPCHPTVDNLKENLWFDLEKQFQKKFFPTSRLDVPTSGLLFLAKNLEAQAHFQNLMKEKKVHKLYQAVVETPGPELGLHEHYMEKTPYAPKTILDTHRPNTQICQLKILKKEIKNNKTLLEIELITGRTHQIRAQLAFLGYPILGDSLYADPTAMKKQDEQIELRCMYLSFPWDNKTFECKLEQSLL